MQLTIPSVPISGATRNEFGAGIGFSELRNAVLVGLAALLVLLILKVFIVVHINLLLLVPTMSIAFMLAGQAKILNRVSIFGFIAYILHFQRSQKTYPYISRCYECSLS